MPEIQSDKVADVPVIFNEACNNYRKDIKATAANVLALKNVVMGWSTGDNLSIETKSEIVANLMLTYRHIEDASMRLGKAIQAFDGGVSVYDKASTVGAN